MCVCKCDGLRRKTVIKTTHNISRSLSQQINKVRALECTRIKSKKNRRKKNSLILAIELSSAKQFYVHSTLNQIAANRKCREWRKSKRERNSKKKMQEKNAREIPTEAQRIHLKRVYAAFSRAHTHTQPISYFALKSISERDAQNILFRILQSSKCNRINLCHVINAFRIRTVVYPLRQLHRCTYHVCMSYNGFQVFFFALVNSNLCVFYCSQEKIMMSSSIIHLL